MELRCTRILGEKKLFHVTTSDGFEVGTIDLRGSHTNQIDRPHATFRVGPKQQWRDVVDRADGLAWLTGLWACKVRQWHAKL